MNDNTYDNNEMERLFHTDLHRYLTARHLVDERMPEAPDLDDLWPRLAQSYLPDGAREFAAYPTAALGWMMYIGMAMAKYWDTDWPLYSKVDDLYRHLLARTDYDHLDEYILDTVLTLPNEQRQQAIDVVAECASRTYNTLLHQHLEPGTPQAFHAFVAALHQLYRMGVAMQLRALGYHMTKM